MKKSKIVVALIGAVALVGIGVGAWAVIADDGDRTTRGVCGAATYELAVETEDGLTEATFELQSSALRETWEVVITQDDTAILRGSRVTDEDGELDVDFPVDAEADELRVSASTLGNEPCVVTLIR